MQLLYTPNSPYSRILRFIILELKLDVELNIEMVKVEVRESADEILKFNPAAKVPSLVLNDGAVLSDTRTICQYFEYLSDRKIVAEITDLAALQNEGLVTGFLDGIAVWVREIARTPDDQSKSIIKLERARADRCLAHFEKHLEFHSDQANYTSVALACAIDLCDSRVGDFWKKDYPLLANWLNHYIQQQNMKMTAPLLV